MHSLWHSVLLFSFISQSSLVQPFPTSGGNGTIAQGKVTIAEKDGDVPKDLLPEPKDDNLPKGDLDDAIQDVDFDLTLDELKECPDFGPDPVEDTKTRRVVERAGRKFYPSILRNVRVSGKSYAGNFDASSASKHIGIKAKGPRGKANPVGMYEQVNKALPRLKSQPTWKQPQRDHVCELGLFTTLADADPPKDISQEAWTTIQNAIGGEGTGDGDQNYKANANTKVLGGILNSVDNLREISMEMNGVKNRIMLTAYEKNKAVNWKSFHRSAAWGTWKYMDKSGSQFDETLSKAAAALASFVKNDAKSAKAIQDYFTAGGKRLNQQARDNVASVLKKPPPDNSNDAVFKKEDCSNTVDTPDDGGDGKKPGSGPQGDSLKCHGIGGDVWMISRDQAVSAAQQFCKQDSKDKEYFQGSVNDVKLSLHNSDDSKPLSAVANCVAAFTKIVDGCDGNDALNNPHDYKFGGTYTSPDGWEFKLEPQAQKPDEDSCHVSYKFFFDSFKVHGKNFPDAKLGANGEGLKKQIEGCGALTKWKFEWTPNDPTYQWVASGHLPIGEKSCVGHAVESAGGSTADGCHGAG